jgi:Ca-activated chloride channel family protein
MRKSAADIFCCSRARLAASDSMKREVILVLDRSDSMAGEKLEQVRAAALQVLEGLNNGESFNIVVYNETVELFAPAPVVKSEQTIDAARSYLRTLRVRGGTNIHDALQEALRMKLTAGVTAVREQAAKRNYSFK